MRVRHAFLATIVTSCRVRHSMFLENKKAVDFSYGLFGLNGAEGGT